jgi:hypothetical protein
MTGGLAAPRRRGSAPQPAERASACPAHNHHRDRKPHCAFVACGAAPSCVAAPALGGRLACAARRPPRGRVGRQRPQRRPRAAGSLRRARAVQQRPVAAPAHGRGRADEGCLAGRRAGAALDGAAGGAGVLGPGVEVGDGCDACVDRGRADVRARVARACERAGCGVAVAGWEDCGEAISGAGRGGLHHAVGCRAASRPGSSVAAGGPPRVRQRGPGRCKPTPAASVPQMQPCPERRAPMGCAQVPFVQ